MNKNTIIADALKLAGMGIPVFPCLSTKAPAIKNGFKSASTDEAVVRALFDRPNVELIGVPTGEISGFDVIDIDPQNGGNEWHEENKKLLENCRMHRTRSGGWHYLLEHLDNVRNSASKLGKGVDVRGDGGYIIWWPAESFATENDETMAWPKEFLDILKPENVEEKNMFVPFERDERAKSLYAEKALENECNNIRSATPGTFNDTINKAGFSIGGFVSSGDLEEGHAMNELQAALSCIIGQCKDKRKADKTLTDSFEAGKRKKRIIPEMTNNFENTDVKIISKKIEKIEKSSLIRKVSDKEIIDGASGVIAEFMNICVEGARRPQPLAAVIAGICLVGTLAGRNTMTHTGLTTNIYSMMVMDSGSGKERARQVIKRILLGDRDLTRFLGPEDFTSSAAIESALCEFPSLLCLFDEAGDLIAAMNNLNSSSSKSTILRTLKTLYTSCGSRFLGTGYANRRERIQTVINNPNLSIIATTTPRQLWGNLSTNILEDGLMARFIVMTPEVQYTTNKNSDKIGSINIRDEFMNSIYRIAKGPNQNSLLQSPDDSIDMFSMDMSDDAKAYVKDMEDRDTKMLINNQGTWVTSIIARITENAQKIALIRAISRESYIIDLEDIKWGEAVAVRSAEEIYSQASLSVAESNNQKIYLEISKILKSWTNKKGTEIMSQSDITRAIRSKFTKKEIEEVINFMVDSGEIVISEQETSGRKKTNYHIMI